MHSLMGGARPWRFCADPEYKQATALLLDWRCRARSAFNVPSGLVDPQGGRALNIDTATPSRQSGNDVSRWGFFEPSGRNAADENTANDSLLRRPTSSVTSPTRVEIRGMPVSSPSEVQLLDGRPGPRSRKQGDGRGGINHRGPAETPERRRENFATLPLVMVVAPPPIAAGPIVVTNTQVGHYTPYPFFLFYQGQTHWLRSGSAILRKGLFGSRVKT